MKKLSVVLAIVMVLMTMANSVAIVNADSVFTDMPDDWSTVALEKAVDNELLTGYDGQIRPGDDLLRSEMATIVNRAFGTYNMADISEYTDVTSTSWYYIQMSLAVNMGTFKGYNSTLKPEQPITREEAFIVIARALKLSKIMEEPVGFNDLDQVSTWAREEVFAMIEAGYVKGYQGNINPKSSITRAEFAQLLDNIIKQYIKEEGEYTEVTEGNVMISVRDVTLKDVTVEGDLILGDGIGDGEVILENVNVTGRLLVRGGGSDSIIIKGTSDINKIIVARVDGEVSIKNESGEIIGEIIVDGKDDVILFGSFGAIEVLADNVDVYAINATFNDGNVTGENSQIIVAVSRPSARSITSAGVTGDYDYIGSELTAYSQPDVARFVWERMEPSGSEYIEIGSDSTYTITEEDIGMLIRVTAVGQAGYRGVITTEPKLVGFAGGDGTSTSPFEIANWFHLDNIRFELDKSFILSSNIDDSTTGYDEVIGAGNLFISIGDMTTKFSGTLDGNEKNISDFLINGELDNIGLFAYMYQASVKDLTFIDSYISGGLNIGTLSGNSNSSIIMNVHVFSPGNRSINGSGYGIGGIIGLSIYDSISKCSNQSNIWSGHYYVGGIVGNAAGDTNSYTTISNSYNSGQIEGASYVGGISGYNMFAKITNCYNNGIILGNSFTGGIVGLTSGDIAGSDSTVTSCYNSGSVSGQDFLGGIAGFISQDTIENCGSTATVSGFSDFGVLFGESDTGMIPESNKEITADQMFNELTYIGWDFTNIWAMNGTDNGGYPFFRAQIDGSYNPVTLDVTMPVSSAVYGKDTSLTDTTPTGGSVLINGDVVEGTFKMKAGQTLSSSEVPIEGTTYPFIATFTPTDTSIKPFDGIVQVAITNAPLTIKSADDIKVYGDVATFVGTEFTSSGLVYSDSVDTVSLSSTGTEMYADVGDYDIFASGATGTNLSYYNITYTKGTMTVNQRPITITAVASNKVYDGTTSSTGIPTVTTGNIVTGQTGSFSQLYSDEDSTTDITLTPSATISHNADSSNVTSNYNITYVNSSGDITKKALTLSLVANNKVYDGTVNATGTITIFSGLVSGDFVSVSGTATFDNKNVGMSKVVSYTGVTLSGIDADNYAVSPTGSTDANITRKALIVTADSNSQTYNGSALTDSGHSASGLVSEDSVHSTTIVGSQTNAGSSTNDMQAVVVYDSSNADMTGNYSITFIDGTLTVYKATPEISSWPYANNEIVRNQSVSLAGLMGGSANVSGSFSYTTPLQEFTTTGKKLANVTFTPSDTTNYNSTNGNISIEVIPLIYNSISVNRETGIITLNFNMDVYKNDYMENIDFTVVTDPGTLDERTLPLLNVSQPNGSSSSFNIEITDVESLLNSEVVTVIIKTSGAGKLVDLEDNTLDTEVLERSKELLEDFEASNGGFTGDELWEWGTPTYPEGPNAYSGDKCWGTNLDGLTPYGVSIHYLYSSVYEMNDVPEVTGVYFSWQQWYILEAFCDSVNLQYSTNGGETWSESVRTFDGVNFNNWHDYGYYVMCEPGDRIQLRWVFTSDASVNYSGYYLDDFKVTTIGEEEH